MHAVKRRALARRGFLIGLGTTLVLILLIGLSINKYRRPPPAPVEALERMAARNRDAAAMAAANQRAQAQAATDAADSIGASERRGAAQQRGAAQANEMLERFNTMDEDR